ncbi:MAG: glycosyltransferase [Atopobiaceae bacterium]|nr:glycosyltransferase [Atopobiaceae bacterium]
MAQDLVSIVVPVYNVERYLPTCVDSLLAQTYTDLEIILVDDGSTDHSPDLCDCYAKKNEHVRVVHKPNGGLSSARNAGIDVAEGTYIAFVDSDDYVDPCYIETLYNAITSSDADLALCAFDLVDESRQRLGTISLDPGIMSTEGFWGRYFVEGSSSVPTGASAAVVAWNKLYKRSIFSTLRYAEGRLYEDEYILCDVISNCKRIVAVSDVLYFYLQRSGSIMGTDQGVRFIEQAESNFYKCRYFIGKDQYGWASSALLRTIGAIAVAQRAIRTEEDAKTVRNAQATYRMLYRIVAPHVPSREMRMRGYLFMCFPRLFSLSLPTLRS